MLGGEAVSWCSKRQPMVTTETKYMSLSASSKEAIWLNKIVADFGLLHTTIYWNRFITMVELTLLKITCIMQGASKVTLASFYMRNYED